jgi:G protein-coupled receptor 128
MRKCFCFSIIANFCEKGTSGIYTFGRIAVGRYGPSLQTCDKDTLNGIFFPKNPLCLDIRISMLSHTNSTNVESLVVGRLHSFS